MCPLGLSQFFFSSSEDFFVSSICTFGFRRSDAVRALLGLLGISFSASVRSGACHPDPHAVVVGTAMRPVVRAGLHPVTVLISPVSPGGFAVDSLGISMRIIMQMGVFLLLAVQHICLSFPCSAATGRTSLPR